MLLCDRLQRAAPHVRGLSVASAPLNGGRVGGLSERVRSALWFSSSVVVLMKTLLLGMCVGLCKGLGHR